MQVIQKEGRRMAVLSPEQIGIILAADVIIFAVSMIILVLYWKER